MSILKLITLIVVFALVSGCDSKEKEKLDYGHIALVGWSEGGASSQSMTLVREQLELLIGEPIKPQHMPGRASLDATFYQWENKGTSRIWLFGALSTLEKWKLDGVREQGIDDYHIYGIWKSLPVLSVPKDSPLYTAQHFVNELKDRPLTVATAGPNSSGDIAVKAMRKYLGLWVHVKEYDSGFAAALGASLGEVDAVAQLLSEQIDLIDGGNLNPIAVFDRVYYGLPNGSLIPSIKWTIPHIPPLTVTFGMAITRPAVPEIIEQLNKNWTSLIVDGKSQIRGNVPFLKTDSNTRTSVMEEINGLIQLDK